MSGPSPSGYEYVPFGVYRGINTDPNVGRTQHVHFPSRLVTKRHSSRAASDGEPMPKRKVDAMNARFNNFHISGSKNENHQKWQELVKRETFQEIEERLTDSEGEMEEDTSEGSEPTDLEDGGEETRANRIKLSDDLRDYLKRSLDKPTIVQSPSQQWAVVPYVPRNPFDDPSMRGRILEVSVAEADDITRLSKAEDLLPDSSYVDEGDYDDDIDDEDSREEESAHFSSPFSIVELPDDSDADMDIE